MLKSALDFSSLLYALIIFIFVIISSAKPLISPCFSTRVLYNFLLFFVMTIARISDNGATITTISASDQLSANIITITIKIWKIPLTTDLNPLSSPSVTFSTSAIIVFIMSPCAVLSM